MKDWIIRRQTEFIAVIVIFSFLNNILSSLTLLLSQHSPPLSSYLQYKEKKKIIQSELCTDSSKFLRRHGRPEVSFIYLSSQVAACMLLCIIVCCFLSLFCAFKMHIDLSISLLSALDYVSHLPICRLCVRQKGSSVVSVIAVCKGIAA